METKKTKNGTKYREKIYINGKASNSPFFLRKQDAKKWKQGKERERDKMRAMGIHYIPDITLNDYCDIFMASRSKHEAKTQQSYSNIIENYLRPTFGKMYLNEITLSKAEKFKSKLLNSDLSRSRVNNILNLLKIILRDAVKKEHLLKSGLDNLEMLKNRQLELNYWTKSECNQFLLANKNSYYLPLYIVALNTGLRKGELCGLLWDCVDLDNKMLTIKRSFDRNGLKSNTKSNKVRTVPMNQDVYNEMLKLKTRNEPKSNDYVFTRPSGKHLDYGHLSFRIFANDIKKAGVKRIRFHDLRTTFASNFCMAGGDIFSLSKILGHSSVKITQDRYAHITPNHLSKEIQILSINIESSPHLALVSC